jgi:hypothetical protein
MTKKVIGVLKSCGVPGSTAKGYRDTWDTGLANNAKKRGKIAGINRPST